MAGEAFYFFFSIVAVLVAVLYLLNLLLIRSKGRTTFGFGFEPGTEEHKRATRLASSRNIVITIVLALAFMANLAYSVNRLINLDDQERAREILIVMPILTMIAFVAMLFVTRRQYRGYNAGRRGHN